MKELVLRLQTNMTCSALKIRIGNSPLFLFYHYVLSNMKIFLSVGSFAYIIGETTLFKLTTKYIEYRKTITKLHHPLPSPFSKSHLSMSMVHALNGQENMFPRVEIILSFKMFPIIDV